MSQNPPLCTPNNLFIRRWQHTQIPKNDQEAAGWFCRALSQGYASAIYELSSSSPHLCLPALYKEVMNCFRAAAEDGHVKVQIALAEMYESGWSFSGGAIVKNIATAAKWYLRAANGGNLNAQYKVATMYRKGIGVDRDYNAALKWFHEAAERGSTWAQYDLGDMFRTGQGMPKNLVRAHMWFTISSRGGLGAAIRDKIAKKMTDEQLEEAGRLAKKWLAEH